MSMNGRYTLFPEIESGASGMLKLDRLHTMYWEEPALHIVTPVSIEVAGTTAKAVSTFAVFRTTTDGETRVYVVGRYEDELIKKAGRWLYASRNAVLQTRLLDAPTHLPI